MKIFSLIIILLFSSQISAQEISKKEKRYIAPKSIFVELGSGLFYAITFAETDGFKGGGSRASWLPFAKVELGLKKNFYAEFEGSTQRYHSSISYHTGGGSGTDPFRATKLSCGVGYRIINAETNYNFGNIKFGASISYQNQIGITSASGGSQGSASSYFESSEYGSGVNKLFPTFYIGFDKDFRISKNIYLGVGYKYDHGFITVHDFSGTYRTAPNGSFLPFYGKVNGSAHSFAIGIKYMINRKKLGTKLI